jgi:hypothetical protein
MKIEIDDELEYKIVVQSLVESLVLSGTLNANRTSDKILNDSLLRVLKYYTTEDELKEILSKVKHDQKNLLQDE